MNLLKSTFFVVFMTIIYTFSAFGQQFADPTDKLSIRVVSDASLNLNVVNQFRLHSSDNGKAPVESKSSSTKTLDQAIKEAEQNYLNAKNTKFFPDFKYEKAKFNPFRIGFLGALNNDKERNYFTSGIAEYFGRYNWSSGSSASSTVEYVIPEEKQAFSVRVKVDDKYTTEQVYLAKLKSQSEKSDFDVIYNFEKIGEASIQPGSYLVDVKIGEDLASAVGSKIYVFIGNQQIAERTSTKDGEARLLFTLNADYSVSNGIYYLKGKQVAKGDRLNIPGEHYFKITSDPYEVSESLVLMSASEDFLDLTQGEVEAAPEKDASVDQPQGAQVSENVKVDKPFALMSLGDMFIEAKNRDLNYDFNITAAGEEKAGVILVKQKGIPNPTPGQKYNQAVREKLKEWIASVFERKRNQEVLKIFKMAFTHAGYENPELAAMTATREIAEWKHSDPNWALHIADKVRTLDLSVPKNSVNFDTYFGVGFVPYSSSAAVTSPDLVYDVGLGVNSGLSYLYAVGSFGKLPLSGSDVSKIVSGAYYVGGVESSLSFNTIWRGFLDAYYYSSGKIRGVVGTSLTFFDNNLSPGLFLDYSTVPANTVALTADVGLFKLFNVGVSFETPSSVTNLYVRFKF